MGSLRDGRSDGLTTEFYKYFWSEIRDLIYNAFKARLDNSTSSPTMKQGIIILIPKPYKDNLSLDNWRPISLLSVDYKLLAHVYANSLKKGLCKIIDETQSAFIKGRHSQSY